MTHKIRIHPDNVRVKWGLGWIPSLRRPVKLWHVVVNGLTRATFDSRAEAWDWIHDRYEISRHD